MTALELIALLEDVIEAAHDLAVGRADVVEAAARIIPPTDTEEYETIGPQPAVAGRSMRSVASAAQAGVIALELVAEDLFQALTEIERWRLLGGGR